MDALETRYLDLVDAHLAYCEHGQGPDLLLLHGNSQSKRIFHRYQLEHFPDFHTVAVDSPGHGESTCRSDELCYAGCCDATCCLCERLGITHCSIIGYSDGANIALLMAKKAPRLLEKVVLVSPNYRVHGMTPGTITVIRFFLRLLHALERLGLNTRNVYRRMKMMMEDLPISEDDLRAMTADITILHAENDVIREEHLRDLAALIPGARLHQIAHCNHLSIMKQPEAIAGMKHSLAA